MFVAYQNFFLDLSQHRVRLSMELDGELESSNKVKNEDVDDNEDENEDEDEDNGGLTITMQTEFTEEDEDCSLDQIEWKPESFEA